MTGERRLATVRDYAGLVQALRKRIDELQTNYESVDQTAGLPLRYTGKLMIGGRSLGSISFGPLLQTLGVDLVMVENLTGYDRIRQRLERRRWHAKNTGLSNTGFRKRRRNRRQHHFKDCSAWGQLARAQQLLAQSPEQRRAIARHAINCRWKRIRSQMAVAAPEAAPAPIPAVGEQP